MAEDDGKSERNTTTSTAAIAGDGASGRKPAIGLIAPPDLPPTDILAVARSAEEAGLDELWLWEDCFATSGLAPAAAILGATSRIAVGIGLMPAPLRTPSLVAMEIATLAEMFPGRFRPGFGHGIQDWMGQAGVRVESPITLLRESVEAMTALLAGQSVTRSGRYVSLDAVQLRWPPTVRPEVLIGGRGPKTLALAGQFADGVILDDVAPDGVVDPQRLAEAVGQVHAARRPAAGEAAADIPARACQVVAFLPVRQGAPRDQVTEAIDALAAGGVTTVAVLVCHADGRPVGDRTLLDVVPLLPR